MEYIDLNNPIILRKVILHLLTLIKEGNLEVDKKHIELIHALKRIENKSLEEVIQIFEEDSDDASYLRALALSCYDEEEDKE